LLIEEVGFSDQSLDDIIVNIDKAVRKLEKSINQ